MAIKHDELDVCLAILFASQEEVGSRGARVGTYAINPDEAIILDVTFAKQPGVSDCAEMGKGAVPLETWGAVFSMNQAFYVSL